MTLAELLEREGITETGAVRLDRLHITKERLIADAPCESYAVMMVVPYPADTGKCFAAFSLIPDYHIFFSQLEEKIKKYIAEKYKDSYARVFADHSPIDERDAACKAGLGVMGDNGLFISDSFGSFVFLGELVCSLTGEQLEAEGVRVLCREVKGCMHCGRCKAACPSGAVGGDKKLCVSNLTQKKGDLSDTEKAIIKKSSYVWGCDICAAVCPMNSRSRKSISFNEFFTSHTFSPQGYESVEKMTEAEYGRYPFSWRKRELLKRNYGLYEEIKAMEEE